jgi:FkbH-like protein
MTETRSAGAAPDRAAARLVKCVVWDLDNTLWGGVLLEDEAVSPRAEVVEVVRALDARGILNSIASRNDHDTAAGRLRQAGLLEYFLHPQIGWNSKSSSIRAIAAALNIDPNTIAFVDDDPFEREEVAFSMPTVRCIDAREIGGLLERPDMKPAFVTEDSRRRRQLYRSDEARAASESRFEGPKERFLAGLGMRFRIAHAREEDLRRAEELTLRTNQLNTTGYTYTYEELDGFRRSDHHDLLVASLEDRYGSYGTIGLALVARQHSTWTIKLLLMSCRVMSRGVGTVLVNHLRQRAREAGVRLLAEFVLTDRNRMMHITYRLCRFRQVERRGGAMVLEADPASIPALPGYVEVSFADDR